MNTFKPGDYAWIDINDEYPVRLKNAVLFDDGDRDVPGWNVVELFQGEVTCFDVDERHLSALFGVDKETTLIEAFKIAEAKAILKNGEVPKWIRPNTR